MGERPFDDPQVRQALNFAIDRRRVLELAGGSSLNALSRQILPPGLPGFTPACPYTRDVTAGGGWTGPDLPRARRLVAASGTRGQRVEVFGPPKFAPIVRYASEVLERLGFPTASSFFESLGCAVLVPASASNLNPAQFCDHGLDAGVTDALAARSISSGSVSRAVTALKPIQAVSEPVERMVGGVKSTPTEEQHRCASP